MLNRSSKPKRPRDLNQLAAALVNEATGEQPAAPADAPEKDPAAVDLGQRGGLRGGRAHAETVTPEQRSEIATKAAEARWQSRNSSAN
jgi:hypothetical protein